MATIVPVKQIPVRGKFSFEMYDGSKYSGPLEKKDLIVRWLVSQHREVNAYPKHIYESMNEIFLSPALFLPPELVPDVSKYIDTRTLPKFNQMIGRNYMNQKDTKRMNNLLLSLEDMYYEFGKDGDVASFYEFEASHKNMDKYNELMSLFLKGMTDGQHYHKTYLFIKNHEGRDRPDLPPVEGYPHANAVNMLLISSGFLDPAEYYQTGNFDLSMEEWEALFDFKMSDEDLVNCISIAHYTEEDMNDKTIDFILTKQPSLTFHFFGKVLHRYVVDDYIETPLEQRYERYFRLLDKYRKNIPNVSDLKMTEEMIDYGFKHGFLNSLTRNKLMEKFIISQES